MPTKGWGQSLLTGNAPRVGSAWTDSGTTHDERHLKHRARKTTRPVPIPHELVALLRSHQDRFGTAPDGRLFRGALLSESSYGRTWQKARNKALTSAQARTPLAGRPYDLRHNGVTMQLNAGVPAPEVAHRAGHGVAVLLRVYAGCIDGHDQLWNSRIDDALRDDETEPEPFRRGYAYSRHSQETPERPGVNEISPRPDRRWSGGCLSMCPPRVRTYRVAQVSAPRVPGSRPREPSGQRRRARPAADYVGLVTDPVLSGRRDPGMRFLHSRPAQRRPCSRPGRDRTRDPAHLHPRRHAAPTGEWTAQQARNLLMDLGEQAPRVMFMIRDRGSNFTATLDAVLAGAGIRTVLCNVRTPRMNAIAGRWIGGCRRELLDRTLIWNQSHLRRILHEYVTHHNQHRPHRSLHAAAPLKPLPKPVDLDQCRVRKQASAGGLINEYRLIA